MPKTNQPFITFQPTAEEKRKLEAYCNSTKRTKTDVLRAYIRTLPEHPQETTTTAE